MTTAKAGWYPDPLGGPQQRFFDGLQWTDHYAPHIATPQIAPPQATFGSIPSPFETTEKKRNPLFFVLAVLSGIPTAFFVVAYFTNNFSTLMGIGLIWCFMWTWVWWRLSDRYR
jgi:hypothetical protein